MLEVAADQCQGLRSLVRPQPLRLVAVVQHGDRSSELPLLWQLCSALEGSGYPAAMLDASRAESDARPGLRQMLHGLLRPIGEPGASRRIIPAFPAASGMDLLLRHASDVQQSLDPLGRLFKDFGALVVYGPASALAALLPGTGTSPLVTVNADRTSVLTAYQALKQLMQAGVTPTLVSLIDAQDPQAAHVARSLGQTMQQCAGTYLGARMPFLTIRNEPAQQQRSSEDIRRLALHLLENAAAICQDAFSAPLWGHPAMNEQQGARSH